LLEDPRLDLRVADGAQQDRLVAAQLVEHAVGQHLAGAHVALAAEIVADLLDLELEPPRGGLYDLLGLGNDLGARAVARQNGDAIRLHGTDRISGSWRGYQVVHAQADRGAV